MRSPPDAAGDAGRHGRTDPGQPGRESTASQHRPARGQRARRRRTGEHRGPGRVEDFHFEALNVGAFIYHCAYGAPWQHIAQGMFGAVIVEPPGGLARSIESSTLCRGNGTRPTRLARRDSRRSTATRRWPSTPSTSPSTGTSTRSPSSIPCKPKWARRCGSSSAWGDRTSVPTSTSSARSSTRSTAGHPTRSSSTKRPRTCHPARYRRSS